MPPPAASAAPHPVWTLPGAPALSPFRKDKLLATLRESVPEALSVDAVYVHFIESTQALKADERAKVQALLGVSAGAAGGPLFGDLPAGERHLHQVCHRRVEHRNRLESYLAELEQMQLSALLEMYQTAYARQFGE